MTKKKNLKKDDSVSWQSHGHSVQGKVKGKITKRTEAAGRSVDASKDEPQYEVESDETGRRAVHKPDSLRRKSSSS
ncbi:MULTISPECIES: DUF2945 domain-containing protein [Streptomyces]|uniref:DUF2945 domain-containing protein n=1 Tax=Streptomyces glycanivorans TaxID=3033808 RepID=A0ABY9J771_9ACTN|nr:MULTISPECIES: DUF2945 domain-containing protein [unclassified Streptomyces]WSQ76568.1 DUF2945 domain-containing protein [Streptomyces sp. NBC_01213]TXS20200.1 DUF2945 domain-containing protein [Streptomyces sp. wa22]WLQ63055.1 DUF2945 domain-containing protein [Streptomyces sp. Alt3]WSQ83898.1 DUF2945 domain-containing protein [Streptomyces sp. NBC_01212]WSR10154.1 DUF2945 domain-containing protein [Streptomyces sp. NBC_01208]